MAIRKHKPTSAGRRFQSVQTFDEITATRPYRPLTQPLKKSGGRNNSGSITIWWRGGGHKRAYRVIDFKRDKIGRACEGVDHRVRSEPVRPYRPGDLRRRREAVHPAPARGEGRRHRRRRSGGGHSSGQHPPAEQRPARHAGSQRRVAARQGRAARAKRRRVRAGRGEGRQVRHGTAALGRDAPRNAEVRRDDRPGRKRRSRERPDRQGRTAALARSPSPRLRECDEPGGSSARRRRRTRGGRAASGVAVGRSGQGYKTRRQKPSDRFIISRKKKR